VATQEVPPRKVKEKVRPVAGQKFQSAVQTKVKGKKTHKLLVLIAAYQDADPSYDPSVNELMARLGDGFQISWFDDLVVSLEEQGFLEVDRCPEQSRRSIYTLRLPGNE
jgi:hypothetical protein